MDFVREVLQFFSDLYELDPQLQACQFLTEKVCLTASLRLNCEEAIAAKSADDDVLRVKLSSLSYFSSWQSCSSGVQLIPLILLQVNIVVFSAI